MTNCSNEFPSTEDYYPVLVRSWVSMMLMALACVLTVGSIIIFIESLLYVIRVNKGHSEKVVKVGTILGLHPIDPAKATIYITVITTISTMLSIYGSLVVHRAAAPYLASFNCGIKWTCIQLVVILPNIQGLIFSILVANDLPPCENTRGPLVRGASLNHFLLVVEMFLLTLLARRAYRMDERDLPLPVTGQGKGEPEEQGLDPNTSGEWPVTDTVL
ncbi:OSTA-like protein [Mya arenaria]|uniref:OSTA-like protein n=1 Tax=Mya arenaria TaxID=6604 RepID=A0ABY7FEF0_MYAAR|nr:OSTA-like protein [Mya arenaria]